MKTMILRRMGTALLAAALCITAVPAEITQAADISLATLADTTDTTRAVDAPQKVSRVSVHDPSIIKADGTYYLFGTHLADAKSDDLMNWTQMNRDWNRRGENGWQNDSVYGEVLKNLAESFAWAGYDDGDVKDGGLGVWAPDVIYNPEYVWEDDTKGAYMLYYSASSTWRRSCIGYAVSKTVEGPYQHVDTIIYSGFTKTGEVDNGKNNGRSERNTKWDNDYLNLKELIKKGTLSDISDKWFTSGGGWNEKYAPNAIDPTVFFSRDGKMYMSYGSWSGGIFILELDKTNGAVKYPGQDGTEPVSGNFIDRYFGTHIAGGNHQSGEGSYILYDSETDYYYLYETYGGLLSHGGYNMRLFRSKDVFGPYVDAAGKNAKDNNRNNDEYGIKLIGNYQFPNQPGYRAAGHNSVFIDDDGQRYLFYHQRFEKEPQTEGHEVRVRKQYLNADGWPVPAVYEYRGEQIAHYEDKEIVGIYDLINHGTSSDGDMISSENLLLLEDGTVGGAMSGTWEKSLGEGKDYDYITLVLDGVTYKGFLYKQFNEESTPQKVMTFSVIGENNTCLWGSRQTARKSLADALIYGFNFETTVSGGKVSPVKSSEKTDKAVLEGEASIATEDSKRGKVLHIQNESGAFITNYLHLPANAFSSVTKDGFTVSMWVNIGTNTLNKSALFEANSKGAANPMTRINANLEAAINAGTKAVGSAYTLNRNEWHHIAYAVDTNGIKLYVDGKIVSLLSEDLSECFDTSLENSIQKATNICVGSGLIYGTEDVQEAKFDDVAIYSAALSTEQIAEIYSSDTLKDAPDPVKSSQTIFVNAVTYNKTYGDKAFSLNAKLKKGNGTLSYTSGNSKIAAVGAKNGKVSIKDTGIVKITITASETSTCKKQTKTVTIKIAPKKTALSTVKSKSAKKAVLTWKTAAKASGYRIQYAANAKFKLANTVMISKATVKTKTISKLKSKETYYFRIQPYKISGKTKVYGAYSKAKKVKIK